jgi:hypothetical protein
MAVEHPVAKRFMVIFAVIFLVGIALVSVWKGEISNWILGVGGIGFIASALIATDKRKAEAQKKTMQPTTMQERPIKFGRTSHFAPGRYLLDLAAVRDTPLQMNGQPSTFVEVYCKLRDSKITETKKSIGLGGDEYITEKGETICLDGDIEEWPLKATMRAFAELFRKGIDPYAVSWFYYDHDWSIDADVSYGFFAVYGNAIISEESFNGEEPLVLKKCENDKPIWRSHEYLDEAWDRYWYRRFYTETMTGQLMVLRPDEPILYHYDRPATQPVQLAQKRELQFWTLYKIYRLLWVAAFLLAALAFQSISAYMGVAAGLLGVDLLRISWVTRNAGKTA